MTCTANNIKTATEGNNPKRVALLGRASSLDRFKSLASILAQTHEIYAAPVIYHDDHRANELEDELCTSESGFDGVICWVDPVSSNINGEEESRANCSGTADCGLDQMLQRISSRGIRVSAHPNIIQKMGTKRVLYDTRNEAWGLSTTCYYKTKTDLRDNLKQSLLNDDNKCRVLKMERGSAGKGVWRCDVMDGSVSGGEDGDGNIFLRVQHAGDVLVEEGVSLADMIARLEERMEKTGGGIVDMSFLPRVSEGIIRCYMFRGRCGGILHQLSVPSSEHPNLNVSHSGRYQREGLKEGRKVHPASSPQYQELVKVLEEEWVPRLVEVVGLSDKDSKLSATQGRIHSSVHDALPVVWDIDFILRPPIVAKGFTAQKDDSGNSKYVLCEINCSCVFPGELMEDMAEEIAKWAKGWK